MRGITTEDTEGHGEERPQIARIAAMDWKLALTKDKRQDAKV